MKLLQKRLFCVVCAITAMASNAGAYAVFDGPTFDLSSTSAVPVTPVMCISNGLLDDPVARVDHIDEFSGVLIGRVSNGLQEVPARSIPAGVHPLIAIGVVTTNTPDRDRDRDRNPSVRDKIFRPHAELDIC